MAEQLHWPAHRLAAAIAAKELSARELLEAHLGQIEKVNPQINAVVTLDEAGARKRAEAADALTISGEPLPALHGIPMTHKDTNNTKGIRTTSGSPILKDNVPEFNDVIIDRLQAGGAVTTGKSNVPEFAAGSHTFNEVFGATKNPYDHSKSAGGSSGGAAAAIAARIQPVGDGSDYGGSLRNPGSFCNVIGFRPSEAVVPKAPSANAWNWQARVGPMAREVADIALVMSVIAGDHPELPFPTPVAPQRFTEPLEKDLTGMRIAWSPDLGLGIPVEKEVLEVLERQLEVFESLGAHVVETAPDLSDADIVFSNGRALDFALQFGDLVRNHREKIKSEVIWNVEKGQGLTGQDWVEMTLARTRLAHNVQKFFGEYDVLASPTVQVLPFDVHETYPTTINGVEMENYLDWMRSASVISATGIPAISMPAGFSSTGLPVGLQLSANHNQDFELLQVAHAFEQATGFAKELPPFLEGAE